MILLLGNKELKKKDLTCFAGTFNLFLRDLYLSEEFHKQQDKEKKRKEKQKKKRKTESCLFFFKTYNKSIITYANYNRQIIQFRSKRALCLVFLIRG